MWARFDPDNPEETIKILPDKKWFVRSKSDIHVLDHETGSSKYLYEYLTDMITLELAYKVLDETDLDMAVKFDTKEEAEEWKNPLTEAVLLPVEE